ncbi:hypothetical protein I302_103435 [Kwoniella bestiolae CBS 10118]|uniref:Oxidoreductase n=1 Tax=Kwoniella bestiolae CBS 10118 TaxID=1296100 RepID=A0A1B9G8C8_9TREE|nr:oxidoreductase [Kwoniella bestiolae CBS 10118]OCF27294.1 oxidoreductase [Kwoniella bestiolae CBS 10118]
MPTVLLTGISGFLSAHVALTFLQNEWTVRGTLRSASKKDEILSIPEYKPYVESGKLQLFVTGSLENGDYTEAIKGVDAVVHTASPVEFGDKEFRESHLAPAEQGTTSVLEAAAKEPTVKSVVVTGTYGSIGNHREHPHTQKGLVLDENDWNPYTIEELDEIAKTGNNPNKTFLAGYLFYMGAKKYAEIAAWDTQKASKKNGDHEWSLAVINCAMIFGPPIQPIKSLSQGGMSTEVLWALAQGADKPGLPTLFTHYVDVRDAAEAHYQAAIRHAQGRFVTAAGPYDYQEIADIARKQFPDQADRFSKVTSEKYCYIDPGTYTLKNDKIKKELGIEFRPKEDTVKDAFTKFFELETKGLN